MKWFKKFHKYNHSDNFTRVRRATGKLRLLVNDVYLNLFVKFVPLILWKFINFSYSCMQHINSTLLPFLILLRTVSIIFSASPSFPHHFHHLPAPPAGARVRENPVPRCVHQGGTGCQPGPVRGKSAGLCKPLKKNNYSRT